MSEKSQPRWKGALTLPGARSLVVVISHGFLCSELGVMRNNSVHHFLDLI